MARKAIFITGAASGIGRATAQLFAAEGWLVGLADVNASGLAETAALLPNASSTQHILDVRDRAQWDDALADFATASGGRLDVMFNNAGIAPGGPLEAMAANDIEQLLDINLKGVIYGAQAALPHFRVTPGSILINTSSAAGIYASANLSVYSATKFGVRAMTEALGREWQPYGIRVAALMPSFIDTPLLDRPAAGSNASARQIVQAAGLEFTPLPDVAQAVWKAAHGKRVHIIVGKTARKLWFASRFAPWLLPRAVVRPAGINTRDGE